MLSLRLAQPAGPRLGRLATGLPATVSGQVVGSTARMRRLPGHPPCRCGCRASPCGGAGGPAGPTEHPFTALRLDPGRPGAVALVLVAVVAAVVAAVGVWTSRPQAEPVRGLPAVAVDGVPGAEANGSDGATTSAGPTATAGVAAAKELVVSVAGRVAHPGVVRVPDGARVADALDRRRWCAAGRRPVRSEPRAPPRRRRADRGRGSARAGRGRSAALRCDGRRGGCWAGVGRCGAGGAGPPAKIDLNTSSVAQLDTLPGSARSPPSTSWSGAAATAASPGWISCGRSTASVNAGSSSSAIW